MRHKIMLSVLGSLGVLVAVLVLFSARTRQQDSDRNESHTNLSQAPETPSPDRANQRTALSETLPRRGQASVSQGPDPESDILLTNSGLNSQPAKSPGDFTGRNNDHDWRPGDFRKLSELKDVGQATPEATFQTAYWAARNNPARLMDILLLPEEFLDRKFLRAVSGADPTNDELGAVLATMVGVHFTDNGIAATEAIAPGDSSAVGSLSTSIGDWTFHYNDLISIPVRQTGPNAAASDSVRNMYFRNVDGVWKLVIPGFSPHDEKTAAPF